jgi:hypothetical protein
MKKLSGAVLFAGMISCSLPWASGAAAQAAAKRDALVESKISADQIALLTKGTVSTIGLDVLPEFSQFAAEGQFSVPIARTFALEDWREALDISLAGHTHGKLVILL